MKKFLAVVKHEYKKIVLKWTFLIATLLGPIVAIGFAVLPGLLISAGGATTTRVVIVDSQGKIAPRFKKNLLREESEQDETAQAQLPQNQMTATQKEQIKRAADQFGEKFTFVEYNTNGKLIEQIKRELNSEITAKKIDAYLLVPANYDAPDAPFEFFSRNANGFGSGSLKSALNNAVRSQRLADANISEDKLKNLSRNVDLTVKKISDKGNEKDTDGVFLVSFIVGLMMYITLLIYGQQIMAAVVEEKETRIAEILFSSAKPFELMMGKLVGVGLAGMTQLAIWVVSALALAIFGLGSINAAGVDVSLPDITLLTIIYFFVFFLLGFFIYATIYALIGSMVTTVQEGGQFAMLPILALVIGFYMSFAVIRDPNSSLSFWVSIAPFLAPITMPVRILAETPPFWQIALSILLNGAAIAGLVWLASRVYRVGMLMYGKRATIPEVWKWIRQS